jgi:hypothetical protein
MSKEVENLKQALELAKSKLQVAEKALNDIVKWNDDLEDEWGDPGERANAALEKIMSKKVELKDETANSDLGAVSNRRELLLAFAEYWNGCSNSLIEETNIDEFLESK